MKDLIQKLSKGEVLKKEETYQALISIGNGEVSEVFSTALIMAYVMRPITAEELEGFRDALLEMALKVDLGVEESIDMCGTGGDGKDTFNISTCASFIVAASGIKVSKHGNYGVSSKVGSSNVMEHLGYQFSNDPAQLQKEIQSCGITFLHAPLFHPAMKQVSNIRKTLGVKTFFNLLGPLVNPAQPKFQFTGVYHPDILPLYQHILEKNTTNFNVVHACDEYDEISLTSPFYLSGKKETETIEIHRLGLNEINATEISGGKKIQDSAEILLNVLKGVASDAQKNAVAANAGLAIHTVKNNGMQNGVQEALAIINSGKAYQVFEQLIQINQQQS